MRKSFKLGNKKNQYVRNLIHNPDLKNKEARGVAQKYIAISLMNLQYSTKSFKYIIEIMVNSLYKPQDEQSRNINIK